MRMPGLPSNPSAEKIDIDENGKKIARVSTSCWYTNLDVENNINKVIMKIETIVKERTKSRS